MTPVFLGALFRAPPPVPRRAPAARTRPRGLRRFARGHRAPATGSGGGDCGGAARAVALIRVANGARPLLPRQQKSMQTMTMGNLCWPAT